MAARRNVPPFVLSWDASLATIGRTLRATGSGQHCFGPTFAPIAWGVPSVDVNGPAGGLFSVYNAGAATGYLHADSGTSALLQARPGCTLKLGAAAGVALTFPTTGEALGRDGVAALPQWSFINDPDTGVFRSAANIIGFSCAGTQTAGMDATGMFGGNGATGAFFIRQAAGTAAAPAFSFIGDTGNGIYRPAANQLGFSTNSAVRMILTNTSLNLQTGVALRLSNNYVAGAPAATGYVTLQDGAGGTMKLLCSNV